MTRRRRARAGFAISTVLAVATGPAAGAQVAQAKSTFPALTRFTVRVENVSKPSTLKRSSGGATAIPLSPGVWAVHVAGNPMITPGKVEPGLGLKGLAEAGMARAFASNLRSVTGVKSLGVFGQPVATEAAPDATGRKADSSTAPPPDEILDPGFHFEFNIEARQGDRLSLAMMIGESNDGLIATGAQGIELFDAGGRPVSGNVTAQVFLWDAGTEVNEEPGLGRNQGMRQGAPHAGDPERRPVRLLSEAEFGGDWPAVHQMVRVTLRPAKK